MTFEDGGSKQLDYGHPPQKCHVADFGSYFEDQELHVDFSEKHMLVLKGYFQLSSVRHYSGFVRLLVFFK